MISAPAPELEEIEVRLLLEAIHLRYGYDFRGYAPGSFRRRLSSVLAERGLDSLTQLQHQVLRDRATFTALLDVLTISVTEMFRDPPFFRSFRRDVVPFLRTYPALKFWIAGCASGEEAHSFAILLHEERLLERALIYATDVNPGALERARAGIYPTDRLKLYADNYQRAGGTESFTGYFTVAHGYAAIAADLRRNIHFAEHNLACDEVFGEMNVVSCRNVLMYFDRVLQEHVIGLLRRSLTRGGFLCLGHRESLRLSVHDPAFEELDAGSKILRKRPDTDHPEGGETSGP